MHKMRYIHGMWLRKYKDYPPDSDLKKEQVESNKGIIGCEMHEFFGWGSSYDQPVKRKKKGFFRTLLGLKAMGL